MAANKIQLLLFLFTIVVVAAEAAPLPAEWTAANKSISAMDTKMKEAFDDLNAAAPPEKRKEVLETTMMQILTAAITVAKAKDTGDEKKVVNIARSYEIASEMVIKAAPADKLRVMEDTFNAVAAPDPLECPNVDKPFCETTSKIKAAFHGVAAAAPPEKLEVLGAVMKQRYGAETTINKAYVQENEKKIAGILASYNKAADAVIAAAPAEKFKVTEEAFTAATAHPGA